MKEEVTAARQGGGGAVQEYCGLGFRGNLRCRAGCFVCRFVSFSIGRFVTLSVGLCFCRSVCRSHCLPVCSSVPLPVDLCLVDTTVSVGLFACWSAASCVDLALSQVFCQSVCLFVFSRSLSGQRSSIAK